MFLEYKYCFVCADVYPETKGQKLCQLLRLIRQAVCSQKCCLHSFDVCASCLVTRQHRIEQIKFMMWFFGIFL